MLKNIKETCIAVILILSISILMIKPVEIYAEAPVYLKSVTYFSDAWPINFWNTESPHMNDELQQIVDDGFNSIILVIPWREFQPDINRPTVYNDYAVKKLNQVMEAAKNHGLWVTVRIGYTWDYYDIDKSVLERYEAILYDTTTQKAWNHYAKTLYQELSAYDNFYGGFITWEDFWNFVGSSFGMNSQAERQKKAKTCGYTDYVKARYSLEELNAMYDQEFRSYTEIYLPKKNQVAAKLFYDFYNEFLNSLLAETQTVFPGLSMEVRLDQDLLYDEDGETYYYNHSATYACEGADYTGAMISIAMGQLNQGEYVPAELAVAVVDEYLSYLRENNNQKLFYFEQFLYMDNTKEFAHNAQVIPEQLPSYINTMAPVLKKHGMGYGIWVYRDYGNNQIYNPQFALGTKGWSMEGSVRVAEIKGTSMAGLKRGAKLKQKLSGNLRGRRTETMRVRFRAYSESPCNLEVALGGQKGSVWIEGDRTYEMNFSNIAASDISFQADGEAWLDDIQVFDFLQEGRLYDIDNRPLDCADAFRQLNQQLE